MVQRTRTFAARLYRIADLLAPAPRLLVAAFLGLGGFYSLWRLPWLAPLFLLPAGWLVWDYLRHNAIWLAFSAFRAGDLAQVRRWLTQIKWPNWLAPVPKTYYHWLRGAVEAADDRLEAARVHLLVAAAGPLRTENDRALVECLLLEVALLAGDHEAARKHLRLAQALDHSSEVTPLLQRGAQRLENGET